MYEDIAFSKPIVLPGHLYNILLCLNTGKIMLLAEKNIKNCKLVGYDKDMLWKNPGLEQLIIGPVISPDNDNIRFEYISHK